MILRRYEELGVYKITISWKISRVVKYGGESYRECWGKVRIEHNARSTERSFQFTLGLSSNVDFVASRVRENANAHDTPKLPYENPL